MPYCSHCGKEIEDGQAFCDNCGQPSNLNVQGVPSGHHYNNMGMNTGRKPEGRTYSILGIVFAFCSLIVLPIIFGPLAVIFGIIGITKNDTNMGVAAIVLGLVLSVLSAILGMMILSGTL